MGEYTLIIILIDPRFLKWSLVLFQPTDPTLSDADTGRVTACLIRLVTVSCPVRLIDN